MVSLCTCLSHIIILFASQHLIAMHCIRLPCNVAYGIQKYVPDICIELDHVKGPVLVTEANYKQVVFFDTIIAEIRIPSLTVQLTVREGMMSSVYVSNPMPRVL